MLDLVRLVRILDQHKCASVASTRQQSDAQRLTIELAGAVVRSVAKRCHVLNTIVIGCVMRDCVVLVRKECLHAATAAL